MYVKTSPTSYLRFYSHNWIVASVVWRDDMHIAQHILQNTNYGCTSSLDIGELVATIYWQRHGLYYSVAYRCIFIITFNIVTCTHFPSKKCWKHSSLGKWNQHFLFKNAAKYPNYFTRVLSLGYICAVQSLYHIVTEYMCLDIMGYCTVCVLFEVLLIVSTQFSN